MKKYSLLMSEQKPSRVSGFISAVDYSCKLSIYVRQHQPSFRESVISSRSSCQKGDKVQK